MIWFPPSISANDVNIERLVNNYGVTLDHQYVMDEVCCESYNNTYGILELYWAPLLQKEHMNQKSVITNNLGNVVMLQTGSLTVEEQEGVKSKVLVESSDRAWTEEPESLLLNPLMITPPEDNSAFEKKTFMVLLEGEFKSAFDEAPSSGDSENQGEGDYKISTHLAKSSQAGKIIVAASSQISSTQVFPEDASSGVSLLLINAIDYLNGNEDMCKMRTKGYSIDVLNTESKSKVTFFQMFNEFGLALIVLIIGLIVWRMRVLRKIRINRQYNPDDERFAENVQKKDESEAKA